MDCNFVRTVALRVIAAALAMVCGVDSASAGFFRIAFKDNGTTTETTQALLATNINKDIANYLTSGSQYISAFDRSTFQYIYQAKEYSGWRIGNGNNDQGKMKISFSPAGQVFVTQIIVGYKGMTSDSQCAININDASEQCKSISAETSGFFKYQFNGEKLESLYISNYPKGRESGKPFYLLSIEVHYESMAFDKQEITVDFAQDVDVEEPSLTNPNGVTVAYSSNNEEVAKVDTESGAVSVCGIGAAVITAKSTTTDEMTSYTLIVKDPEMREAQQSFSGYESITELSIGDGHISFAEAAVCGAGMVIFESDNPLTVSAPYGYYLTAIEFIDIVTDAPISASTGNVAAGKWLPAQGNVAVNTVEFTVTASGYYPFSGLKISYLPFRIDHANTSTTVDFAATESTANSINLSSTIKNSGKSEVDRFIIRANGAQIAEAQKDAASVDLTALPYLEGVRFTISPVIDGLERQAETLDGATLPNLSTINFTIGSQKLLFAPTDNGNAKIYAFVRIANSAELPANMLQDFTVTVAGYPGATCKYGNNAINVYVPDYIASVPMDGALPDLSGVEFPTLTISLTPTYQFIVAEGFRSLLTASAERPMRANSLGDDGIQTVTYDDQQIPVEFDSDSEVSLQIDPVAVADSARYYNLQGIEVSPDALTSGIYIRRQGTTLTKIHIRP